MVLDAKIKHLYEHFGIQKPEDWTDVLPGSILALHNIGESTLNHLRLHLAARGLTLRGDQTPAFWQSHLSAKVGTSQISESDDIIVCPFRVLVDSREQLPFTFKGMRADADKNWAPMIVETVTVSLGNAHGDYSLEGYRGQCHVERKSLQDCQGTVLGWGDRRKQFELTLETLAGMQSSAVVVECSLGELIKSAPSRGKKTANENAKILHRQVMAWQDDYRVPWIFADTPRLAEISAFRWLYRYWRHQQKNQKAANKPRLSDKELEALI